MRICDRGFRKEGSIRNLQSSIRNYLVLAPGLEPGSRSNLELTGYKPAALPFVLRQEIGARRKTDIPVCPLLFKDRQKYLSYLVLAAGVEPACFQLRLTPLEAETDTRAKGISDCAFRSSDCNLGFTKSAF